MIEWTFANVYLFAAIMSSIMLMMVCIYFYESKHDMNGEGNGYLLVTAYILAILVAILLIGTTRKNKQK